MGVLLWCPLKDHTVDQFDALMIEQALLSQLFVFLPSPPPQLRGFLGRERSRAMGKGSVHGFIIGVNDRATFDLRFSEGRDGCILWDRGR